VLVSKSAAMALYALKRYGQSQELLRTMACEDKKRESAPFKRTIKRIKELESGSYNWAPMHFHDGENKNPYKDNTIYVGPVAVKDSPSRGRGLFLTKAVKAGNLILCEKAFSYSYLSENLYEGIRESQSSTILIQALPPRLRKRRGCGPLSENLCGIHHWFPRSWTCIMIHTSPQTLLKLIESRSLICEVTEIQSMYG
jgi:hypothetical protein